MSHLEIFGETAIEDGKFGMMSLNEESERSEGFGFISPIDKMYRSTDFRRIYENGGVFLLDEVDAANANTLTALNAAISAPFASFPDKIVKRKPRLYSDCSSQHLRQRSWMACMLVGMN